MADKTSKKSAPSSKTGLKAEDGKALAAHKSGGEIHIHHPTHQNVIKGHGHGHKHRGSHTTEDGKEEAHGKHHHAKPKGGSHIHHDTKPRASKGQVTRGIAESHMHHPHHDPVAAKPASSKTSTKSNPKPPSKK